MIRAFDLFHRCVMTPNEKKELAVANKVAKKFYDRRFESPYSENWGCDPKDLTFEAVEQYVIRAFTQGEKEV